MRNPRAGFTLLEVMMAVIVLAFGIVTTITAIQRGYGFLDSARNLGYASQIMETELELVRTSTWSTVSGYSSSPETVSLPTGFSSLPAVSGRFTLTRTATLVHTGMMRIDFKVTWTTYDGRTLSRTYTTYFAENGIYD